MYQRFRAFFVSENIGLMLAPFWIAAIVLFIAACIFAKRMADNVDAKLSNAKHSPTAALMATRLTEVETAITQNHLSKTSVMQNLAAAQTQARALSQSDTTTVAYAQGFDSLKNNLDATSANAWQAQLFGTFWLWSAIGALVLWPFTYVLLELNLDTRWRVQERLRRVA